jgi:hypothetical protein
MPRAASWCSPPYATLKWQGTLHIGGQVKDCRPLVPRASSGVSRVAACGIINASLVQHHALVKTAPMPRGPHVAPCSAAWCYAACQVYVHACPPGLGGGGRAQAVEGAQHQVGEHDGHEVRQQHVGGRLGSVGRAATAQGPGNWVRACAVGLSYLSRLHVVERVHAGCTCAGCAGCLLPLLLDPCMAPPILYHCAPAGRTRPGTPGSRRAEAGHRARWRPRAWSWTPGCQLRGAQGRGGGGEARARKALGEQRLQG